MRKNAFTLIELLAVIVILAIISLIATPVILNIINDSKENSLKRSIDLYMNSVKTSITKESMNPNFPKGEITCTILNEKSEGTEYDKDDLICVEDDNENISSYVKIDIKGETPINGIIKLNNGKIIEEGTWLEISNSIFYKYESNTIKKLTEDEINNLKSRLPKEYQEVEYIESTGTQYINTLISPIYDDTFIFEYSHSQVTVGYCAIMGAASDGENYRVYISDFISHRYFGNVAFERPSIEEKYRYEFTLNKDEKSILKIDDKEKISSKLIIEDLPMMLFARNKSNGKAIGKMYSFIWQRNMKNIMNLIPCYSKTKVIDADGVERPKGTVGMYDLVEGKFYTNQGTGEFIKGPDV